MTELSVVILCYRSEGRVVDFARRTKALVEQLSSSYEIVLVANYFEEANDRTREYVEALAREDEHFVTICKPKEGMMGWDMRSGLEKASGMYICVIDGDGQFPIDSIKRCYQEICTGKYGLVKTYRSKRNDGWWRRTISYVYNSLFAILYPGLHAKDINSKPKILTREAYNKMMLTSDDWFIDAEIMINVRARRIPFLEFAVEFTALEDRASFVKAGAIVEFLVNLVAYRFKFFKDR